MRQAPPSLPARHVCTEIRSQHNWSIVQERLRSSSIVWMEAEIQRLELRATTLSYARDHP